MSFDENAIVNCDSMIFRAVLFDACYIDSLLEQYYYYLVIFLNDGRKIKERYSSELSAIRAKNQLLESLKGLSACNQ